MVVYYADGLSESELHIDRVFHALADHTRRDILRQSIEGERSVSVLARAYSMSFAAVQKHVAVLERAGLITKRPCGREQLVRIDIDELRNAQRLFEQFETLWRDRIDQFANILDEQ